MTARCCLFAIVVCAACGSPTTPGATGGGPIPVANIGQELAKAQCHLDATCPGRKFFTEADCLAFAAFDDDFSNTFIADLVAAGKVKYDGGKARACFSALTCDKGFESVPACAEAVVGTVANGAACTSNNECASDHCESSGFGCPGTCKARVKAGEACQVNANNCERGFGCAGGKCVADGSGKAGDACGFNSCGKGLFCDFDKNTCKAQLDVGGKCGDSSACKDGLRCRQDGVSDGKCSALAKAGESCWNGSYGDKSLCESGLACLDAAAGGAATCTKPAAKGDACTSIDLCVFKDLTCAGEAGKQTCTFLPKLGEACAGPCFPPNVCDPGKKVCVARPTSGQACIDGSCATGLRCASDGKCAAKAKAGEACKNFDDCEKGLDCSNDKCAKPTCGS